MRRPRLDYGSNAVGLDRNEFGAMLVAAGLAGARDHALISLLGLNGLRVSEALGIDIDDLGLQRGHRTVTVLRQPRRSPNYHDLRPPPPIPRPPRHLMGGPEGRWSSRWRESAETSPIRELGQARVLAGPLAGVHSTPPDP